MLPAFLSAFGSGRAAAGCQMRDAGAGPAGTGRLTGWILPALAAAAWLGAGFVALATARMMRLAWIVLPYWDQWDNLVAGRSVTWAWLVSQHNEHRILFPRLIFLLDARLAQETGGLTLLANFVIPCITAGLLAQLGRPLLPAGRAAACIIAAFTTALMLSAVGWENLIFPFQVQFILVDFAAVASLSRLGQGPAGWPTLAGALGFATLAVFSLASGILVPCVLLALSVTLGRPRRQTLALAVAAALLLGAYLWGYATPAQHSHPLAALGDPVGLGAYLLNELGAVPEALTGRVTLPLRLASGGCGVGLFAALLLTSRRRPAQLAAAEAPMLGLALFVVAMCGLTALGRARFGLEQANAGRYITPVLMFWIAILLLAAGRLPASLRAFGLSGLAALTIGVAVLEPRLVSPALRYARTLQAALPAVLVPNGDATFLGRLYPDPAIVTARLPLLRAAGASVFAEPWSRWLGRPLPGGAPSPTLPRCRGAVARLDRLAAGWRVSGQLAVQAWPAPRLVFLDAQARLVGLGLAGLDARAVGAPPTADRGIADRWLGETIAVDPSTVTALALDDRDRPACSLGPLRPSAP